MNDSIEFAQWLVAKYHDLNFNVNDIDTYYIYYMAETKTSEELYYLVQRGEISFYQYLKIQLLIK